MPAAPIPSDDNQKCLQILPNVPWMGAWGRKVVRKIYLVEGHWAKKKLGRIAKLGFADRPTY